MSVKEILGMMARAYCIIVTGIVFGIWAGGTLLMPLARLSPRGLGHILLTAFVAVLFFFIFYSRRELSRREMILRVMIHFALLVPCMTLLAYLWSWLPKGEPAFFVAYLIIFLLIYITVFFGVFLKDVRLAARMNAALEKRRQGLANTKNKDE